MNNIDRIDEKKFFMNQALQRSPDKRPFKESWKNSMQEPRQAQYVQPKNGEWLECTARCCRYEWQHQSIQGKTREMVEEWPDIIKILGPRK